MNSRPSLLEPKRAGNDSQGILKISAHVRDLFHPMRQKMVFRERERWTCDESRPESHIYQTNEVVVVLHGEYEEILGTRWIYAQLAEIANASSTSNCTHHSLPVNVFHKHIKDLIQEYDLSSNSFPFILHLQYIVCDSKKSILSVDNANL